MKLLTGKLFDVRLLTGKLLTGFTHKIENHAARAGRFYRLACAYYRDVIEREAVLADISARDKILCIGGGICPFSAILFHQLTGAAVTVIDNNAACIPKARQTISRLGLSEHVKVLCGEGAEVSFDGYTVVHIALQVTPVEQVFSRAEEAAAAGTKILVRRPQRARVQQRPYRAIGRENALPDFCPYVKHSTRNIGSTMLYIKAV